MYEIDLTPTFEPTRSRAFISHKAGTTSPDHTRSRAAKAHSMTLRTARKRKGGR